jgi:hypothetical protein
MTPNRWLRALPLAASLAGSSLAAHAEGDTSFKVGGYVKLDAILSSRSAGVDSVGDQMLVPSLIPVGPNAGAHKTNQFTMHARQSRLSLATSTPTAEGALTTYVEGDFFGDLNNTNETSTNSSGFRLRHAFGRLGGFLGGQTWTNLFNTDAYPETLDFGGALGELFIRQAQVRWTQKSGGGEWSVSAENPESILAVPGTATLFRSDSDHVPDVTARLHLGAARGTYDVSVLARNIHVDSASAPAASSGKWGGAIAFTGIVPTIGKDELRMNLNAGNAIGRYQGGAFFPDGYVDAAGSLHLARQTSGYVAYRHFWSPSLRSTLEVSAATSAPPADTFHGINQADQSQHLNLIWRAAQNLDVGAELIHARRIVTGGDAGGLNRIQFSAQYSFL